MQMLYAVDLDVTNSDGDPAGAFVRLFEHLYSWLTWRATDAPTFDELKQDGEATYQKFSTDNKPENLRKAEWRTTGSDNFRAFRVDVRQPLPAEGTWFQTRITISRQDNSVRIRVVLGRDLTTGWISPVPFDILRRPRIILDVTRDSQLDVRVLGQRVDDRFIPIRDKDELKSLFEALRNSNRLPILVVSPANQVGRDFASGCSRELQGLARVVTLRPYLWQGFNGVFEDSVVPFGGGRIYWPDLTLRQPEFSAEELLRNSPADSVHRVMRLLAPMSVIARSRDFGWNSAVEAERKRRDDESRRRLNYARASGDQQEEVRLLVEALSQKEHAISEWEELSESLASEMDQLKADLQNLSDYKYQAEHWKAEYFKVVRGNSGTPLPSWSEAPSVQADNIGDLLSFAENVSDGSFQYTGNCAKAWQRSGYPFHEAMREAILTLAQASVEYREIGGKIGRRFEEWIEEYYGLRVAMSDKGLVNAALDEFQFEGVSYSRIPHVKLDDHTSPNRVGRIYFAIDSAGLRFIVDHAGLKLYGL